MSSVSEPLVSVVVPCFNYERYVAAALRSALEQDWPALEIIAVDDGSTDRTPEVLASFGDRIRVIRRPNGGLNAATDTGVAAAGGEFITFLDADDTWPSGRVRALVEALLEHPQAGISYGDMTVVDADGNPLHASFNALRGFDPPPSGRFLGRMLSGNYVSAGSLLVRASLRDRFHPIPPFAAWNDWWIATQVLREAEIVAVSASVNIYRQHGANMNLGADEAHHVSLLCRELPFRRWLLANTAPPLVAAEDLLRALEAFDRSLARIATHEGQPPGELLAEDPEAGRSALAAGLSHWRAGETDEALAALVAAVAHRPLHPEPRRLLARGCHLRADAPVPAAQSAARQRPAGSDRRLAIAIPTYQRAEDVARLLRVLDMEIATAGEDVAVIVSDNGSTDGTARVLEEAAARHPWLTVHRQPANLGAHANQEWLVHHAPPAQYTWMLGDDDMPQPGALTAVLELLRAEEPVWLHLPHRWVHPDGRVAGGSPAPGAVQVYAGSAELYRACTHWLTFLSASVIRTRELQAAAAATVTDNLYFPFLWFFRAGLRGRCVLADRHLVDGGTEISWTDRRHEVVTLHYTSLYDEGLSGAMSAEEFGRSLDTLYTPEFPFELWERVPRAALAATVERFPHSASLRACLWRLARAEARRDLLPVLASASRGSGAESEAADLIAAGEAAFANGDLEAAAQRFGRAVELCPTSAPAWNDLAVTMHALGCGDPTSLVDTALFVAPDDVDALLNRAALRLGSGDRDGAEADARRVALADPDNAGARQLLALACN